MANKISVVINAPGYMGNIPFSDTLEVGAGLKPSNDSATPNRNLLISANGTGEVRLGSPTQVTRVLGDLAVAGILNVLGTGQSAFDEDLIVKGDFKVGDGVGTDTFDIADALILRDFNFDGTQNHALQVASVVTAGGSLSLSAGSTSGAATGAGSLSLVAGSAVSTTPGLQGNVTIQAGGNGTTEGSISIGTLAASSITIGRAGAGVAVSIPASVALGTAGADVVAVNGYVSTDINFVPANRRILVRQELPAVGGKSLTVQSGQGGAGTVTLPAGAGGALVLQAGAAGAFNTGGGAVGGSVSIDAGAGNSSIGPIPGDVNVGATTARFINIGNAGSTITLTDTSATTSANVTAANLNTLTAGPASNADALHTHSGLTATANAVKITCVANNTVVDATYDTAGVTIGDAVSFYYNSTDAVSVVRRACVYNDSVPGGPATGVAILDTNPTKDIVGLAFADAAGGAAATVVTSGELVLTLAEASVAFGGTAPTTADVGKIVVSNGNADPTLASHGKLGLRGVGGLPYSEAGSWIVRLGFVKDVTGSNVVLHVQPEYAFANLATLK